MMRRWLVCPLVLAFGVRAWQGPAAQRLAVRSARRAAVRGATDSAATDAIAATDAPPTAAEFVSAYASGWTREWCCHTNRCAQATAQSARRHGWVNKPVRPRKSLSSADRWQPTCRYWVCGYRGAQSYLGPRSQGRRRRRSRCWAALQMMWSLPDCQLMPTSPLATPAASLPDLFA